MMFIYIVHFIDWIVNTIDTAIVPPNFSNTQSLCAVCSAVLCAVWNWIGTCMIAHSDTAAVCSQRDSLNGFQAGLQATNIPFALHTRNSMTHKDLSLRYTLSVTSQRTIGVYRVETERTIQIRIQYALRATDDGDNDENEKRMDGWFDHITVGVCFGGAIWLDEWKKSVGVEAADCLNHHRQECIRWKQRDITALRSFVR